MNNSPYKDRVKNLKEKLENAGVDSMLIVNPHNCRYYSGFTGSNGWLWITKKNAYIITDGRYFNQVAREAPDFELMKTPQGEGKKLYLTFSRKVKEENAAGRIGFEAQTLTVELFENIRKNLDGVEFVPCDDAIQQARLIKTRWEVEKIRRAVKIAEEAFGNTRGCIKPGATEREIAALLDYNIKMAGGRKESFDTIVASGTNGAYPHAKTTDRKLQEGDAVTIDWGALCDGYVSDMTRTVFVGKPNKDVLEIYRVVYEAQVKALDAVKPGITSGELDAVAREIIENAGFGKYFSHGLGHGVGLAVHEGPTLNRNVDIVLETGMVVTVEPGIYIEGRGGVRIEDMALVTPDSREVLTSLPKIKY